MSISKVEVLEWLRSTRLVTGEACAEGLDWVDTQPLDATADDMWRNCPHGHFMLWAAQAAHVGFDLLTEAVTETMRRAVCEHMPKLMAATGKFDALPAIDPSEVMAEATLNRIAMANSDGADVVDEHVNWIVEALAVAVEDGEMAQAAHTVLLALEVFGAAAMAAESAKCADDVRRVIGPPSTWAIFAAAAA